MYPGGEFRAVIELCSEANYSNPEERALCEETVEYYRSKLMGYCYNVQMENPFDEFCTTALPEPTERMQNILGERARRGRQLVIPNLPRDFDDLPELLQDEFDEDTYDAILNDESLPGPESRYGEWRLALRFAYDFLGIGTLIDAQGPNSPSMEVRSPTSFVSRFGGRLEGGYRFDFGLLLLGGADYMINYSNNGGDVHTVDGVLGVGYSFRTSENFDFEISLITKLGYLFSSGLIYHDALDDEASFSNFDASLGGRIDFVAHGDMWCFLVGLEGNRTFTRAEEDNLTVSVFPYSLMLTMGAGIS